MRSLEEIKEAEGNLPSSQDQSRFHGMTYEQGWEEALAWVLNEDSLIESDDIEPPHHKDY